jgi:hypothetical protein
MIHGIPPYFQARIHHARAKDQKLSPEGPAWKHPQGGREVPHGQRKRRYDDIDERTGTSVMLVLESKHPDARIPDADDLPANQILPDFVDLDITEDSIEVTARHLSRARRRAGRN